MKNNKLLYLLTIIISLFTFNTSVNAAQELTCVYEKGKYGKLILIQHDTGEYEFYINDNDVELGGDGWTEKKFDSVWFDWDHLNHHLENEKQILTSCPQKVRMLNHYQVFFYGSNIGNPTDEYKNLEENGEYKEVKIISPTLTETKEGGITEGISCDTLILNPNQLIIEKLNEQMYDLSCIYALDINGSVYKGPNVAFYNGCQVIQIDLKKSGEIFVRQNYPFDPLSKNVEYASKNIGKYTIRIFPENMNGVQLKNNNSGRCPNQIYIKREDDSNSEYYSFSIDTKVSLVAKDGYNSYPLIQANGKNLETGEKIEEYNPNIIGPQVNFLNCASLFEGDEGENLKRILSFAINIIKILIPVLLIGLGIMDFAKAIFSGSEDNMKKTQAKFIKRIILAVVIFLIPTLITFVLEIFNLVWDKNISTDFCGIIK